MKEVSRHIVLFSFLMFFVAQIVRAEDVDQELYISLDVQNYFYQLFYESAFGYDSTECAAWIIHENDSYTWQNWPPIKEKHKQAWNRPIPHGAVAIAHTHAADDNAKPSANDILTAKRVQLPVYTISIGGIWKVTPDGTVYHIKAFNWHKEIKARCQKSPDGNRQLKCSGELLPMNVSDGILHHSDGATFASHVEAMLSLCAIRAQWFALKLSQPQQSLQCSFHRRTSSPQYDSFGDRFLRDWLVLDQVR